MQLPSLKKGTWYRFGPSPGQQERWICKGRLWRLRWSLCGAFVSLRLGGSLDGLRGRWYEGTGEGGRLRCRLWRPLKGCRHLSGDGLLQRRGCISWIHCNLHPYLWIMFHKPGCGGTAFLRRGPIRTPPIAISLLIFLPKGKEHEIQNLMPTKFCASDGPAVPSSILCSCWTSRVRTPVAVSHTSCTHTAWIEWIEIKTAATAATEMATWPSR